MHQKWRYRHSTSRCFCPQSFTNYIISGNWDPIGYYMGTRPTPRTKWSQVHARVSCRTWPLLTGYRISRVWSRKYNAVLWVQFSQYWPAIDFKSPPPIEKFAYPHGKSLPWERLPALSAEVAAEIGRRVKVREESNVLEAIQEAHEEQSSRQRRSNRAMQMRVPHLIVPKALKPLSCQCHKQRLSHDQDLSHPEQNLIST